MRKDSTTSKKLGSRKLERILGIIAIATIVGAWILGFLQVKADILPSLHEALPQASRFELVNQDSYAALTSISKGYSKAVSEKGPPFAGSEIHY